MFGVLGELRAVADGHRKPAGGWGPGVGSGGERGWPSVPTGLAWRALEPRSESGGEAAPVSRAELRVRVAGV
jgi:hypothetical protein